MQLLVLHSTNTCNDSTLTASVAWRCMFSSLPVANRFSCSFSCSFVRVFVSEFCVCKCCYTLHILLGEDREIILSLICAFLSRIPLFLSSFFWDFVIASSPFWTLEFKLCVALVLGTLYYVVLFLLLIHVCLSFLSHALTLAFAALF